MTPEIYLESVEQKGDQLTIKGNSPNEGAVTQFGRSLEFSSGLFSNLGIETQRKDMPGAVAVANDPNAQLPQIVNFTIRCAYTPTKANTTNAAMAATQPPGAAPNTTAATAPPQTATTNPQVARN